MTRTWLELSLVLATGVAHLIFQEMLGWQGAYIAAAIAFWAVYVAWQLRRPGQARAWGFRADTLAPSLRANGALFAIAAAAMLLYGLLRGRGVPPASFFYLLALYPIWGLIQQLLLCALIGQNIFVLSGRRAIAVAIAALLFGAVHLPNAALCALTGAAALAWLPIFFRWPNLWVQAVSHGWLAALAYFYVLDRNPWDDLVKSVGF